MSRAFLVLALLTACGAKRDPLPVLGEVGAFELTDESARPFTGAALAGKIWIADFIYSTCTGPCPRMSRLMKEAQENTSARLVSFTVDPARDTPEVLAAYAKRYAADPARWTFLTGSRETLHRLKREAFRLGDVDGSLNHSTRLVLIDARGRIRGYYGTDEDSPVARLARDIEQLTEDPS